MRWTTPVALSPAPVADSPPETVDLLALTRLTDHPALVVLVAEHSRISQVLIGYQQRLEEIAQARSRLQYRHMDLMAEADGAHSSVGNHLGGYEIERSPALGQLDVEELEIKKALVDTRQQLEQSEQAMAAARKRLATEIESHLGAMAAPLLEAEATALKALLIPVVQLSTIAACAHRLLGRLTIHQAAVDLGTLTNRLKAVEHMLARLKTPHP